MASDLDDIGPRGKASLSRGEKLQVMMLIAQGWQQAESASALGISAATMSTSFPKGLLQGYVKRRKGDFGS